MKNKANVLRRILVMLLCVATMLCLGTALAACGDDAPTNVPPEAVKEETLLYDGTKFSWEAVAGAEKYTLVINEGNPSVTKSTSFTKSISSLGKDVTTVSISIVAANEFGESAATVREFTKLDDVTNITFTAADEGCEMSWDSVEYASGYQLRINGKTQDIEETVFSDFPYGETATIAVRALGDDTNFSVWSADVSKTFLGEPTDISYDGQYIKWRGNTKASSYIVYINNNEYETVTGNTELRYSADNADFSIAVKANGNGDSVYNSKLSPKKEYKYLKRVEELQAVDGEIVWEKIAGAVKYDVKIDGQTKQQTDNKFAPSAGRTIRVQVRPVGGDDAEYFTTWSEEKTFKILSAPVLQWNPTGGLDGNAEACVFWNSNTDAGGGFTVRLTRPDGTVVDTNAPATNPSFSEAYLDVGVYKVKAKALATPSSDSCDSQWSKELTIERLPAPTLRSNEPVTSDATDLSKGFTVHFGTVSGASNYALLSNGVSVKEAGTGSVTSITLTGLTNANDSGNSITSYKLRSLGNYKSPLSGNLKITLDSLTDTQGVSEFNVTVLPAPRNIAIAEFDVTWDPVSGNNGYNVFAIGSTPAKATNANYKLTEIKTPGEYTLSVSAAGNGGNVLPSPRSTTVNLTKLDKPTGIKMNTGVNEGVLTCTAVTNAHGYIAYFNGQTQGDIIEQNGTWPQVNEKISEGKTTVVLQARGNYWASDNSRYYITSEMSDTKQFTKIEALTISQMRFSGRALIWDKPSNVSSNVNIGYEIYDETDTAYQAGSQSGRSFDLSSLNSNKTGSKTFRIRCVGDADTYVSSEMSTPITCTILATPTVTRPENGRAYTWANVTSALGYTVQIGGNKVKDIPIAGAHEDVFSYEPEFDTYRQTVTVTITAVGTSGTTLGDGAVIASEPWTIEQSMTRITQPKIKFEYASTASNPNDYKIDGKFFAHNEGVIRVSIAQTSANASDYELTVGAGVKKLGTAQYVDFPAASVGDYNISGIALGGTFAADGTFRYDSEKINGVYIRGDNTEITGGTLTVMSAPSGGDAIKKESDRISWNSVGTGSYVITLKDSNNNTVTKTINTISLTKEEILKANSSFNYDGIKEITIRRLGNGETTITSAQATKVFNV